MGVFFERKVSALIQDRIGANRATILGFAGHGLINTLVADPLKFLPKEDVVPAGRDRLLHFAARRCIAVFPALVAFAVDAVRRRRSRSATARSICRSASLDVGILYVLAMASLGVYGVVLGGWASNNRWSLLGGIRGSAQMISYEIAMGLALVGVVLTYGTLDLQEMARAAGRAHLGLAAGLGHLLSAARVPDLPRRRHRRVEAHPVRSARERVRAGQRLLHRVLGREAPDVHDDRLRRGRAGGRRSSRRSSSAAGRSRTSGATGFHFPGGVHVALPSLIVVVAPGRVVHR